MSPHNIATERYDFKSPHGIDYDWEPTLKLPESLGWTLNHILSMISTHNRHKPDDITTLRNAFIEAMRNNPDVARQAYDNFLPGFILGPYLQSLLKRIPKSGHVKSLGRELAKLIHCHQNGAVVDWQEWKDIKARLRIAKERAANLENLEHRSCLDFIFKAFSLATTNETPGTYAHILREIVNASVCLGDSANETYNTLAQKLLEWMTYSVKHALKYSGPPIRKLNRPAIKLLQQLGTFSPVKDHHRT